jgi:pilus assembly protein Flp/PilA
VTTLFAHLFALTVVTKERFTSEERGATAVEYGLLVGLIAVAIIVVVATLGKQLASLFSGVSNKLPAATP